MKNKKIILFFLLVSLVTKAEEYNENTITKNNWATIEPDKNKTRVEKTTNKIKYEIEYNDGDIIGTKAKQVPQYGSTINNIIESVNMTATGDERTKDITETTIKTPGKLNIIHVDDGSSIDWQVGVHVYNSNSKDVDRSETILNFDTNTDFNIKTHKKYDGNFYPIYNIVDTVGQGNSSKPVSIINFLKKVNMKNEIQTVNPGNLKNYEKRVNVFFNQSNGGGETHLTFNDDLSMLTKSTTDNLEITAFRLENNGENRYRTVSTKDVIDIEQGGSTVTFDGNVESSISGNTNTGMQFLANTNYHGGLHVEAKEGKNFQSTIINESTSNTNNILNLNTDTRNHGLSVFTFKSNTDLVTKASRGITWGIYMNGDSHGENRVTISGTKNSISTIGNDYVYGIDISASINDENGADYAKVGQGKNLLDLDNSNVTTESTSTDKPWVYGIKSSAVDGENTVRLHNSNIKTGSNFVARSIDIRDENLGKNNFELENTSIETEGQYSYGINLQSNSESDGKGENSINFKGNNNIYSKALSNAYGIRIEKDRANIGKGTTITSDKDSNVNIKIETENSGYGISQIHKEANNKTETTFNGDVSITMNGNGNKKIAVYNVAPENATDDSKSTIAFNKKLNIVGAPTDPALVSSGKNAEITVAGKDNVNILGNIFTSNEGKVSLNLLNKNSHLIGFANNNSTGIIDTKLANSSHWLMTDDSKINTLDISSEGTIDFLDAESPVTLSVDNLKGNGGIFKMQGNVQTGETDLLSIKNSSEGNHYIEFENMAGAKSSGTEVLKLVESLGNEVDNNATFKLKNPNDRVDIPEDNSKPTNPGVLIERGAYLYALGRATDSKVVDTGDKNKNNWYLYPYKEEEKIKPVEPPKIIDDKPGKLTPGAETSLIFNDLIYQLNLVSIETLVQRLGEVHFDKDIIKNNNVWIKHINGKYSGENLRTGKYRHRYWGMEVGYDWAKAREKWINYNGLLFGHIESSAKFGNYPGKSKIAGEELGLYSTWLNKENNVYYDFVAKATRYKGQYDIENYSKQKVSSNKAHIKSYLLSVEAGKRIFLNQSEKKEYYIQPEAQLKYQFTNGYNLNLSNGLQVRTEDLDSLIGRIGFRAGLDSFANESINPYIKLMYEKEFLGKVRHHFNESGMEEVRNKDHWFTYGLGLTNINKEKGRQIYLEIQKSSKHRIKQKWQINLGMRYTL
ncbi:autotransporter outer membrane beta-barrel domain-containing protein [Fusobacterium massiliense]|uniref:autotransporter outer membrane beta-barrel domain-containing protein n=1 Tax=Fusobacterium massiliense TaxID=1852365 RepID=UPI0028EE5D29|nr:autotransporter outer membrane beta-barrel domain-containing protein [Fusobacterium massiliense]